jgi:DNA polymerase zeta
VLSVEVHVQTRDKLRPDPDVDPITAIFYSIFNDVPESSAEPTADHGVIVNREMLIGEQHFQNCRKKAFRVTMAENEVDLFEKLHELVLLWDPEVFAGYEIELNSWGYLLQRGSTIEVNLKKLLSRIPGETVHDYNADNGEQGDFVEFNVEVSNFVFNDLLLFLYQLYLF